MAEEHSITSATKQKRRRFQYSLRTLLIVATLAPAILGFGIKAIIEYVNRPTSEEIQQRLYKEFAETNPSSLKGWTITIPSKDNRGGIWFKWSKNGIAYFDRNEDGVPDMKYREYPIMSTTDVWWEDADYNGTFETEMVAACSGYHPRPLSRTFAVPATPSE